MQMQIFMKKNYFQIGLLLVLFSFSSNAKVIGVVDNIKTINGGAEVSGWACEVGNESSIDIHILVEKVKGVIANGKANLTSEREVNKRCQTTIAKHRFKIQVTKSSYWLHNGANINVFGISPTNSGNGRLRDSIASMMLPKADVIGFLDKVLREDTKYYLFGWACLQGKNQSIDILIKANTTITGKANLANGNSNKINDYCKTKDFFHRFKIELSDSYIKQNAGEIPSIAGLLAKKNTSKTMISMGNIVRIPDLKYRKLDNSVPKSTLHYLSNANYDVSTGAHIELKSNNSISNVWTKFSLSPATAHASAWGRQEQLIVVSAMKGTNSGSIEKFMFSTDSKGSITLASTEKSTSCQVKSTGYCIRNPHDILYNTADDYFYYIDSEIGRNARGDYLVRFKSFKDLRTQSDSFQYIDLTQKLAQLYKNGESVNLTTQKSYSRSLALIKGKIHITHTSYGDVIVVNDFLKGELTLHHFGDNTHPVPLGSFAKNGLVLNEVEYFNGYYYGTNYYDGTNEPFRFVRWKTWQEFNRENIEDLSYFLKKNTLPYYLTVINDSMYLVGLKENRIYLFTPLN